jgi:two-component system C4-dicarboxylate transport response regulator DctD
MDEPKDVSVVLVEDDEDVRLGAEQALDLAGLRVAAFGSVEAARAAVLPGGATVVVSDVRLPGTGGLEWQRELLALDAQLPVILLTGHGDIAMAVQAMRDGAYDFLAKPFAADQLVAVVRRAADKRRLTLQVQALRRQLDAVQGLEAALIGRSAAIARVRQQVAALAPSAADVVVQGEAGTGKALIARSLHEHGGRREGPFVSLNCAALAEAEGGLPALVAEACGGTLFLDEVEALSPAAQLKLFQALQAPSFDGRLVAATRADLRALGDQGRFRSDLFYRLGVAFIAVPPLRERRDDVPVLFEHFVLAAARRYRQPVPELTPSQMAELLGHAWPGNARELRNVADRFVLGLLGDQLLGPEAQGELPAGLAEQMALVERTILEDELRRHGGDVSAVSRVLRVPKPTLYEKLRRLGLGRGRAGG